MTNNNDKRKKRKKSHWKGVKLHPKGEGGLNEVSSIAFLHFLLHPAMA